MDTIEKIQDDIFKIKRRMIYHKEIGNEFEVKRLNLVLKRRIRHLYEYNLKEQKDNMNVFKRMYYKMIL